MREEVISIIEEYNINGICFQVAETKYEFGRHYVVLMNGVPGFHSTDRDRTLQYLRSTVGRM